MRRRSAWASEGLTAAGPGEDKYTTAGVAPLSSTDVDALGLGVPGTLTVGTLSDAPPSICIDSAGQFTGFDNELLRAIADKLGLRVNFVGTEFSGLLAQVASRVDSERIYRYDFAPAKLTQLGSPEGMVDKVQNIFSEPEPSPTTRPNQEPCPPRN